MPSKTSYAVGVSLAAVFMIPGETMASTCDDGRSMTLEARKNLPDGIVETAETPYHSFVIVKEGQRLFMRFRIRGYERNNQSAIDLTEPEHLVFPYAQMFTLASVYVPKPQSMLMLGVGGGTVSQYMHRHIKTMKVDAVEVDEGVLMCAKKYFGFQENENFKSHIQDGRVFLRRRKNEKYDIIYVDAFRAGYVPFHMLTKEFYDLLVSRLTPNGVVAFNLHNGNKLYLRSLKTISKTFSTFDTFKQGKTSVIVAYNTPQKTWDELHQSAQKVQNLYRFPHNVTQLLSRKTNENMQEYFMEQVLTDDFAPANLLQSVKRLNTDLK